MEDTCVICGKYVPEGTMVCADCLTKSAFIKTNLNDKRSILSDYRKRHHGKKLSFQSKYPSAY